ncbi:MAG: insulinase family protein [Treponema sp.]|jgi:predicted Zn-dependent peptidase|nr:insulinase family protein [Treponema sp.]
MITRRQLPNGVPLITEEVPESRVCALSFRFAIGSRHESGQLSGITHFVEHLLFKGTANRSAFDIAAAFDRIGGYINAYTERECLVVYCVAPALHVETALEILCDMTEHSLFREEEIEREREVIISEIVSARDDPEEAAADAVAETVFPKQRISASISGSEKNIRSLSREDLFAWYTEKIARGPLSVYAAGGMDAAVVETCAASLSARTNISVELERPAWKSGVSLITADFRQEQFFFLTPLAYPLEERRCFAWAILNALIGDTMSSRLFQRLREENGFCYNVYSYFVLYEDAGFWCAYASSARKMTVQVVNALFEELHRLAAGGIGDDEISAAKEHLCGEEIISEEDMEYRMKRLMRNHLNGFERHTLEDTLVFIRDIRKDELELLLRELLDFQRMAFVVYGPALPIRTKKKIITAAASKMNNCRGE